MRNQVEAILVATAEVRNFRVLSHYGKGRRPFTRRHLMGPKPQ